MKALPLTRQTMHEERIRPALRRFHFRRFKAWGKKLADGGEVTLNDNEITQAFKADLMQRQIDISKLTLKEKESA